MLGEKFRDNAQRHRAIAADDQRSRRRLPRKATSDATLATRSRSRQSRLRPTLRPGPAGSNAGVGVPDLLVAALRVGAAPPDDIGHDLLPGGKVTELFDHDLLHRLPLRVEIPVHHEVAKPHHVQDPR